LREGDLLFFNTTGGVSHVGMYLANNKFVHSSSSNGVTISDMFDPYYASRMIGAGRVPDEHRALQTEASPRP
jgi:lipoprotein Spr